MHDPGLLIIPLSDITRDSVLEAIGEYDRLGQEGFLERYRFDRARQYLLVHDGRRYDSKAIVGVAHGFLPGESPLVAGEFSGGEATVGRLLRRLGFTVQVGEALTADGLVRLLSKLQVYRRDGLPALYQPITLRGRSAAPSMTSRGLPPGQRRASRSATCSTATAAPGRVIASITR